MKRLPADYSLRVWSPSARAPRSVSVPWQGSVALDRELLGVRDSRVSRAANAPRLTEVEPGRLELEVPELTAHELQVFRGTSFRELQAGLAKSATDWPVTPESLDKPGCLARGERQSLGLVALPSKDEPAVIHALVPMVGHLTVPRGEVVSVGVPSVILVGPAAVEVGPGATGASEHPRVDPSALEATLLRLPPLALDDTALERLVSLQSFEPRGALRIPEREGDVRFVDLPRVAARLLRRCRSPHAFFPVLEDDVHVLLGFGFQLRDGSLHMKIAPTSAQAWVDGIAACQRTAVSASAR